VQFHDFKKSKAIKHLLRKEHSCEKQALVIFLRFKSLSSDEFHWHSAGEVFRMTGIKQCSQFKIINRWRLRKFLIFKAKREGNKEVMTKEQIKWVIDFDTLESMSHLSLRKRA
jgi:hypothetical protein